MTKESIMNATSAVRYEQEIPEVIKALVGVHQAMVGEGFDRTVTHLVHLRASQINGCAHCLKMHLKEARHDGETDERLDRLVVWRNVSDFSEREKAALAWTEALTSLEKPSDLGALRAQLRQHFSEKEIGLLTAEVAQINLWNRLQVSNHQVSNH
jgi:AhpD family alkylhydroperoxidase